MENQTKICQNCKQDFIIEPDDFGFYEKMQVPAPKYCPPCRMQRRLLHRNERTLYKSRCDRCRVDAVSIYPPGVPWPVYCNTCWWGDGWDGKEFGMDYDPNRPFFEQYIELRDKVPRINLLCIKSVNSEYTNNAEDNKNCYLIFAAEKCEDCMYGRLVQRCKSVLDTAWIYDSELCYECLDVRQCHGCMFCERCQTSTNLLFCFDVRDSQDCILSTNLRHAQYYIENKKYDKEAYLKKKKEILASQESVELAKKRFEELKAKSIVKYAFQTKCNKATGDYLYNVHSSRMMFDTENAKDCAYTADAETPEDCMDCNNVYYKPQLCLDVMGSLQTYNCKFSTYIMYCTGVEYSDGLQNCEDCFGSIALKKAKYCILNKQYSREEYFARITSIKNQMTNAGEYGDFLPPSLSPFTYNESQAIQYFPMTKEEVLAKGWKWRDQTPSLHKITMTDDQIPDSIHDVKDSILDEILGCGKCGKAFRLINMELQLLRRWKFPVPRYCHDCRHAERLSRINPPRLYDRKCMKCGTGIRTSYSPDRPETVYCEQCYQQEVV